MFDFGKIYNILKRSTFVRNVAVLVSGTAIAQGITLAAALVIARLYGPNDFGILGIFAATSSIIGVGASWKYHVAIVLPRDDEDAANVLALSSSIVTFTALLSASVMVLAGDWIVRLLDSPRLALVIWWIPVAVFLIGFHDISTHWATRRKNFKTIGVSHILNSGGMAIVQTLGGVARVGSVGLIGGNVAGRCLSILVLVTQIYRQEQRELYRAIRIQKMIDMARENYKFPKYTLPQGLINRTSANLPVFLLAYFFDPTVAGLYWFTARLMRAPSTLIGKSVFHVFYQKAVEIHRNHEHLSRDGDLFSALNRATFGLAAIGICPVAILVAFAPVLFDLVFGPAWYEAGVHAQWMIISWFFIFIAAPSRSLVPVFGLQRISLAYHVGLLIFRTLAISLGAFIGDEVTAIALYSIVGVIFGVLFTSYIFFTTKRLVRTQKA